MIPWFGGYFIVIVFFYLLKALKVIDNSYLVIASVKNAAGIMSNPEFDDYAKEKALQAESIQLFKYFFLILLGSLLALGLPLGLIWGFSQTSLMSYDSVIMTTLTWQFILAATFLGLVMFWFNTLNR